MGLRLPSINQVALTGRLAQDPEFRITERGIARLTGRLAVNRSYRNADDEWVDEVGFFNLTIWGRLAERAADRLGKGTPLFLSGRLRSHSWRDDDHNPHSLVEIVVRSFQILDPPGRGSAEAVEAVDGGEGEADEDLAACPKG